MFCSSSSTKQEDDLSQPSIPISLSQPNFSQPNQHSYSPQRFPVTQAHVSQPDVLATSSEASNDLVKALAEANTANRIPIP